MAGIPSRSSAGILDDRQFSFSSIVILASNQSSRFSIGSELSQKGVFFFSIDLSPFLYLLY